MHLKFLDRGTGSAAVAAAYLLADKDSAGKVRASVEVLRGDPKLVAAVADGLSFKHKYTSGVCAWSAEDAPTQPEIERFVDEFERTAWSGLDPARYAWSVVVHRDDDGGVHLHTFSARCDLVTGLSLNVAPPGWQATFDPLRDAFNYEYGWSRPDDPARARPSRPAPGRVHRDRAAQRVGEDVEPDPREEVGKHLLELVAAGKVKDRAGVVAALQECGYEVPRQGEHYVTARSPETGERWRLRGALYERDFERERFMREAPDRSGDRERADGGDAASSAAAKAWKAVEEERRRRAEYHRKHYGRGSRTSGDQIQDESGSAAAPAGHDASLAAHLQRELEEDAVVAVTDASESTQYRRPDAGAGRGERGLVPAAALAEATRAAGPDLSRALSEHVAIRERAVCATSMAEQWLGDEQRKVLEDEDRLLTVGERAHAVETVESRLEADLSRRESEIDAMSLGPALLREAFGERGDGDGDARLSFATRDRVLEQVEQRVGETLTVQEEALRSIPFGRQCLSEVQDRSEDVESVAVPLGERESRVRRAKQLVREELDRLEKEHVARAGHEDLLVEATGALGGDSRTLSLGERWDVYERAQSRFEEEQRELNREEAAVEKDPAGEEFLRNARLEVLGAADREATLAERARIVKAAAALQKAAEAKREAEVAAGRDLDRREEALRSLSIGAKLLAAAEQELLGKGKRPEALSARAAVVGDAERRADEALKGREEALRSRSLGERDGEPVAVEIAGAWLYESKHAALEAGRRQRGGLPDRGRREQALVWAEQQMERLDALHEAEALHPFFERLSELGPSHRPADIERSLDHAEEDRRAAAALRQASVDALSGDERVFFEEKLDALDPQRRETGTPKTTHVDAAVDYARARVVALDEEIEGRRAVIEQTLGDGHARLLAAGFGEASRQEKVEALAVMEAHLAENFTRREERVRSDGAGEEFLERGRREVLGAAGRQAETLPERGRVIVAAEMYLRQAEQRRRAEAERREARHQSISDTPGGDARLGAAGWDEARTDSERDQVLAIVERDLAADFERREEVLRSDETGEALLHRGRLEVLEADREAATLAERGRIIEQAEALLQKAEAERRRQAELDDREKRLVKSAGSDELLVGAFNELCMTDGSFGDGSSLSERWRIITLAEQWHEEDRAEEAKRSVALDDLEAMLKKTSSGAQHFAAAQQEVLGEVKEPATLDERDSVVRMAVQAVEQELGRRETALVEQPAGSRVLREMKPEVGEDGAALSLVEHEKLLDGVERRLEEEADARRASEERQLLSKPGGRDLYFAVLTGLDPGWWDSGQTAVENIDAALAAAASDSDRLERLRDVLADPADAACYRAALAERGDRFTVADVDAAIEAVLRRRADLAERREACYQLIISDTPGGDERLRAAGWEEARTDSEQDRVLTTVERDLTADFDRREKALRTDNQGDEFLRRARLAVLVADREAATLAERGRVIERAEMDREAARRQAERQQKLAAVAIEQQLREEAARRRREEEEAARRREEEAARQQEEERQRRELAGREVAIRAMSSGSQRLDAERRAKFGTTKRSLSVDEETSIVEVVELQVTEDLAQRETEVAARVGGTALLRAVPKRRGQAASSGSLAEREETVMAVEQRLRAADAVEALLPTTAPDPTRLDYRVPAVSNAALDQAVTADDPLFVQDVVFLLRERYTRRAQDAGNGYDASARTTSQQRYLGSALASAVQWCVLKIRELILTACQKVLGGRSGEGERVQSALATTGTERREHQRAAESAAEKVAIEVEAFSEAARALGGRSGEGERVQSALATTGTERREHQRAAESAAEKVAIEVEAFSEAARASGQDPVAVLEQETARRQQVLDAAEAAGVDYQAVYAAAEAASAASGFDAIEAATERQQEAESKARGLGIDVDAVYAAARSKNADPLVVLEKETERSREVISYVKAIGFPIQELDAIWGAAEAKRPGSGYTTMRAECVRRKAREEMRKVLPFEAPDRARPGARVLAVYDEMAEVLLREVEDDEFAHGILSEVLAESAGSTEEREQAADFYHRRQIQIEQKRLERERSGWFSSKPTQEEGKQAVLKCFVPVLTARVRKACDVHDLDSLMARAVEEDRERRVVDALASTLPRASYPGVSSQRMAVSDERLDRITARTGDAFVKEFIAAKFLEGYSDDAYGRSRAEEDYLGPRIRKKEQSGLRREQAEAAVHEEYEVELLRRIEAVWREVQPRAAAEVWRERAKAASVSRSPADAPSPARGADEQARRADWNWSV